MSVLHLRLVCPPETTEAALGILRAEPGATHLVLLPGAALDPSGDVIEADVARERSGHPAKASTRSCGRSWWQGPARSPGSR